MNGLAIICIAFGVLIVVTRGPLVFAPEYTLRLYRKVLETRFRIRVMGLIVLPLPVWLILVAQDHPHQGADIMIGLGYVFTVAVVFLLIIFADFFRFVANAVLDGMDSLILRGIGVIALGIGGVFIYLGLAVFR